MFKTHNKLLLQILFWTFVSLGKGNCHNDDLANHYGMPFKQYLDQQMRGHGTAHMKSEELQNFLNHGLEHSNDVVSLLEHADSERYLNKLTNYVRLSNMEVATKSKFYRDSYELCKRHIDQGEDWNDVLLTLIENTDTFSDAELVAFLNSDNQYVRQRSQESLDKRKRDRDREARNCATLHNGQRDKVGPSGDVARMDKDGLRQTYFKPTVVAGVMLALIVCLISLLWLRKSKA